jgi:alpha-tubulin suppressor-like RCC1 family protein
VTAGTYHTLALADDGRVYAWGEGRAASWGSLGLGPSVQAAGIYACVDTPKPIPAIRVTTVRRVNSELQ